MLVKRVGHSLSYSDHDKGTLYAIGGISDQDVKTKLCEKYII